MTVLNIENLTRARFIRRPNRYLAIVALGDEEVTVHVHDPGRLTELLFEGNICLIKYAAAPKRKTSWDMIAAQKGDEYVLIHSGYHRAIAESILNNPSINPFGAFLSYKAEAKYGKSRIDFLVKSAHDERPLWIEVKGCSLSVGGVALFPDAPTTRGTRHLEELMEIVQGGGRAGVLLLILSEADIFVPKKDTDPKFYEAFYKAIKNGVVVYPVLLKCHSDGRIEYKGIVPIEGVEYE